MTSHSARIHWGEADFKAPAAYRVAGMSAQGAAE